MAVPYSFFEVFLVGSPEDLPPGRPQVRDRHLKFHEALFAERDICPHLHKLWCAILGLNQMVLISRFSGFVDGFKVLWCSRSRPARGLESGFWPAAIRVSRPAAVRYRRHVEPAC